MNECEKLAIFAVTVSILLNCLNLESFNDEGHRFQGMYSFLQPEALQSLICWLD